MAVIVGKNFVLGSNQIVKNDKKNFNDMEIYTNKIDNKCTNHGGKYDKAKFKVFNGVRVPLLTNKNGDKIEAFLKLDMLETRNNVDVSPLKNASQIKTNGRGIRLLHSSEKRTENAREHQHRLLDKIGPYHWQTFREKAAMPHDARDKFYFGRISDYGLHNRHHESRLHCMVQQRPSTVAERQHIFKNTPQHHDHCLTPRKRHSMVIQFDNVEQEQREEAPASIFQVRRMKTDLGRFCTSDKEDDYTPKLWMIMHGERPMKCEFTRPRYGQRNNTPKTYLICLPSVNTEMKYKSAESYKRYVETKQADTRSKHDEGEEINNSSERSHSRHSKLMASDQKGLDIPGSGKQFIIKKETHDAMDDNTNPSISKHLIPSGEANISCIGIKPDGVMTPAYGYDTLVLQSVINVNQPQQEPLSELSDKT